MKVLIGSLHHETNTFSPDVISYDRWVNEAYREGDEIKDLYQKKPHAIGGMLQALKDSEEAVDVVFGMDMTRLSASGGVVEQKVLDVFIEKMLEYIERNQPLDGILLSLHGAMQTTECDDPEGAVIERLRQAVGERVIIAATTDLHGYISDKMVENADIITGYHTYPHVDQFDTGYRAANLLLRKWHGEPLKMVKARVPMLAPAAAAAQTIKGPFADLQAYAKELVENKEIADYSIYQMQVWLDVEVGGSSVVVIGTDEERLYRICRELAERLLGFTKIQSEKLYTIDEVLDAAISNDTGKPVILVDGADSPNAGASGVSMDVAKRILERNLDLTAAIILIDVPGVKRAFEVGVGNSGIFRLGGSIDKTLPYIEAEGMVRSLHTGEFTCEGPAYRGMVQQLGKTAVIRFGKLDVVVAEKISCPGDPQIYRAFGIEPVLYDLIDVKAVGSFRMAYTKFTDLIYAADTQGSASTNVKRLNFQKIPKSEFWPWSDLEDYKIHEFVWGK